MKKTFQDFYIILNLILIVFLIRHVLLDYFIFQIAFELRDILLNYVVILRLIYEKTNEKKENRELTSIWYIAYSITNLAISSGNTSFWKVSCSRQHSATLKGLIENDECNNR